MTIKHLAGAWADRIGALASAEANGLVPKRRTCIQVQPPQGGATIRLPLGTDIAEGFYSRATPGACCIHPPTQISTRHATCSATKWIPRSVLIGLFA